MAKTSKEKKEVQAFKRKRLSKTEQKKLKEIINNPRVFSRIKQEYFDIDYWDKLSEMEQLLYAKYMFESLGANLTNALFHLSAKSRKQVFDANNARNRDIYSTSKAQGKLMFADNLKIAEYLETKQESDFNGLNDVEDAMIDRLDKLREEIQYTESLEGNDDSSTDAD